MVVAVVLCAFGVSAAAEAPAPSCRLFDTGTRSMLIHPQQLAVRKGWTAVAEGAGANAFVGDAVLMNDKVAVFVPRAGDGTFFCYTCGEGARWRVTFQPRPFATGGVALKVVENTAGAVDLDVAGQGPSNEAVALRLRVTAGEPLVQVRPGPGLEKVQLLWAATHVVVPDFFGDDAVFPAEAAGRGRVGLPAENVVLALQGASILACVWEASDVRADLSPSPHGDQPIGIVGCREGKRLWVACLDGPDLWQRLTVGDGERPLDVLRRFKPPFPAKWRASFVGEGGACDSVTFEQPPDAAPVPDGWRGPVIIYPIDRSRATPLTTLLPVDVLRATLGVGPCEYVLEAEGLGSGDAPPTPAAVTQWIERLVKRKRAAEAADEIRGRLAAMGTYLAAVRGRIDGYAAFGRLVRAACRAAANDPAAAADVAALVAICDRLDRDVARGRAAMGTAEEATRLAGLLEATARTVPATPDAIESCEKMGEALRGVGAAHEATLARCRMAARRVAAQCRGGTSDLAKTVGAMARATRQHAPGKPGG